MLMMQKTHRHYKHNFWHAFKSANKRLYSEQERYKRDYNTKVFSNQLLKPGQMVYTDKRSIAASPASNAERLATTNYNMVLHKVMELFGIVSVETSTLIIEEEKSITRCRLTVQR